MSDHQHDFVLTRGWALECACGKSSRPSNTDSLPSVAEIKHGVGLVDVDEKQTSQIVTEPNEPTRRK